ncbi:MAG: glutamine amidotransferase [Kiritimatiellae bacterium]|nr:glutamine amidotransferase [Kiritimatiellia bacterium]
MNGIRQLSIALLAFALGSIAVHAASPDTTNARPSAVLFFGAYTQWYKFDKALDDHLILTANAHSTRVQNFPAVRDLFRAKVVVLSDVIGTEFSVSQIKLLHTFVERGGGLLVMGGPFTLGVGKLKETGLIDMLPVSDLEPFDLKWEKEGKTFAQTGAGAVPGGVALDSSPMVYWIHQLKPKPDATVVLKAGDYPLLITGQFGKGKVAIFAGTPLGEPNEGQTPFWKWEQWPKFLGNVARGLE